MTRSTKRGTQGNKARSTSTSSRLRSYHQGVAKSNEWPRRVGIASAAAIVLLLVGVVALNSPPVRGVPDGTEVVAVDPPTHVEGDIHDEGEVPAGGAHSAAWQNCGFYETEIRSENAVHSLEHGAVWITYRPDLPPNQITQLASLVNRQDKILVSPVSGQGAAVIATAWANQLELDDANDGRLQQFINEFEGSLSAPEPGGLCSGGVG